MCRVILFKELFSLLIATLVYSSIARTSHKDGKFTPIYIIKVADTIGTMNYNIIQSSFVDTNIED